MTTQVDVKKSVEAGIEIGTGALQQADITGNTFKNDGRTLLLVNNMSGGTKTLTILANKSVYSLEGHGRLVKENIVATLPNMTIHSFGPFPVSQWNDNKGNVTFDLGPDTGNTFVGVLRVPKDTDLF